MTPRAGNPRVQQNLSIASFPSVGVSEASITLDPGEHATFTATTSPQNHELSLWDYELSIYVDVDLDNNYRYPDGFQLDDFGSDSLGTGNIVFQQWKDWATSSDTLNTRVHKIYIANLHLLTHTFYLKFKTYTLSPVAGS